MRSFRLARLLLLLPLMGSPVSALSASVYKPAVLIERDHQTFTVNADGTYTQTIDKAIRMKTAKGAADNGSSEVSYISSQEDILSVEAWTVTPEGVRIPVLESAIREREEDNSAGAAEFSDTKYKVIIFPRVEVGSLTAYKLKSNVHVSAYPGEFDRSFGFSPGTPYRDWQVDFVLPASKTLYIEKRGVTGGLQKTVNGLSYYSFRYVRESTLAREPGSVGLIHYGDYLFVSTMPDMLALGRVAKEFFQPNVEITDEVRVLAQRLTAGKTDERAKAKELYTWVAQNIRYVAMAFGDGRLVPRKASTILHNRYGDCKDHVVLLESLLSAVGIESSPALISSEANYIFSGIGNHYPIDHVITYIPSLDLYLDSTDNFSPFGTLPYGDMNKPVVLTSLNKLGRTPPMMAAENTVEAVVHMRIQPDGTIRGVSKAKMTGVFENRSRIVRASKESSDQEAVVKDLLFRFNETGSGHMTFPDPADISKPFGVDGAFTLEPLANMPGRGALAMPVGLAPGDIAGLGSRTPESKLNFPSKCASRLIEERYTLTFPSNVAIDAIPKSVSFRRGDIQYQSRFSLSGRKVTLHRSLRLQRASQMCGEKEREDWLAFYKVLQRDLRSQIIYKENAI